MAYTTKAVELIEQAGTAATYTAAPDTGAGNGFQIASDDSHRTLVDIDATSNTVVVTVRTPGTVDGLGITDYGVTVTNGTHKFLPLHRLMTQSDGNYYIDFDVITGVTVAALRCPFE